MIANKYKTQSNLVRSELSGGRLHHTYRRGVKATGEYDHKVTYGENFHSLSAIIFGTDELWWAIADLNRPQDSFNLRIGQDVKLPTGIVRDSEGSKKFV